MRTVLDAVGGRLEVMYWMFGKHDGIAIVDTARTARRHFAPPGDTAS